MLFVRTFLAISMLFVSFSPLFAAKHAMLIGVSNYPTLQPRYQLYGPTNDVELMYQVLLERGFENKNFRLLADGIEGAIEPTYSNIVSELKKLVNRVESGDFVYLHFSGHGSKQKNPLEDEDNERDGMDEIFLAKDVSIWPESDGLVKNVLVDDQVNEFTNKLTGKGAYVWWVFDSCQSSTMLRGDPPATIRDRAIPAAELGVNVDSSSSMTGNATRGNNTLENDQDSTFIALYGAESNQFASELELPIGDPSRRVHGFLSYNLAQVLSSAQPGITYRQLNQQLLQNYSAVNFSSATPAMEGAMKDNSIFEEEESERIQQWPISITETGLWIRAGRLHGINEQTTFAIMDKATSSDEEAISVASMIEVNTLRSKIQAENNQFDGSLKGKFARLLANEPRFTLTATKPVLSDRTNELQSKTNEVINKLDSNSSIEIVNWLPADEVGDISLRFKENELLFLDPGASLIDDPVAINLDQNEEELSSQISKTLFSIAKAQNILRVVAKLQSGRKNKLLETSLDLKQDGQLSKNVDISRSIDVKDGDDVTLTFNVKNEDPRGVDVTVLFIDSRYGITPLYPALGETGRIVPDEVEEPLELTVNADTKGTEYLLIIAVKVDESAQAADYSFLAQETLPATTRSRGEGVENESLASISELLTRAAFAEQVQTRGVSVKAPKPKYFNMDLVRLRISPDN